MSCICGKVKNKKVSLDMGYLLKKINETGDIKRREGSRRPKSSRTENNINAVKELISSQEDNLEHMLRPTRYQK